MNKKTEIFFFKKISFLLGCVFFLCFFSACKVTKKVPKSKPVLLEEKSPQFLLEQLFGCEFNWEWINAKTTATVTSNNKTTTFNVTLKMKQDSVIWMSISPALGIEVSRIYISKDSVKLLDRINSKYILGDFPYLNQMLDLTVELSMLQSLIVGNYFSYVDNRKLKSSYIDEPYYILSTLRKRKLKRSLEETDDNKEPLRRVIEDVWIHPETYRIIKTRIDDNKMNREMEVYYDDFRMVEGEKLFPHKMKVFIKTKSPIEISLEYTKVTIDKPQEFPFSVPEKYEKIH